MDGEHPAATFRQRSNRGGANTSTGSNIFIGPTTFDGSITSSGSNLFTGQNTFSSQGVFGNSQPNDFVQSLLNSCNPGTEFQIVQGRQKDTAAYTGCVTVPANSTVHQASAVAGFVNNASPSTNAVGGYFQAVNNVSNGYIWGINPLIASVPGKPTAKMQNEFDVNVSNTSDQGAGITFNGLWTAQPTMDRCFESHGLPEVGHSPRRRPALKAECSLANSRLRSTFQSLDSRYQCRKHFPHCHRTERMLQRY
jgi:hypothetical protein